MQDSGANWQFGKDTGFGYGWTLQIGSITPYYTGWINGVDHYVFSDGTGAQYRLDQHSGTVWSSTQGINVWFDSSTNRLYFPSGLFWLMGCVSSGQEADVGTMYPTVIQDPEGNQVVVTYKPGIGSTAQWNTSSRILQIADVRGVAIGYWGYGYLPGNPATYLFNYNTDPIPHLTSIVNQIGTAEDFSFSYASSSLAPPFGADSTYSGQTTAQLSTVQQETPFYSCCYYWNPLRATPPYEFTYDTAGASELLKVRFPQGGALRWTYSTATYAGGRLLREVASRYLAADAAASVEWGPYPFTHSDSAGTIATVHSDTTLADASGIGAKTWTFYTGTSAPWKIGLTTDFAQLSGVGGSVIMRDSYTWSQSSSGNPYISAKTHTLDEGTSNAQSALTTQTVDGYGNLTQLVTYPFNNADSPRFRSPILL